MAGKRRKSKRRTVTLGGMSQSAFAGSSMVKKPQAKPKPQKPESEQPGPNTKKTQDEANDADSD